MRNVRFPIAGLMGAVLVAALGMAALRNASASWAGATFLLTCAVLCLAIVGVVCRGEAERAWWLGFALFGWGYLALAFWSSFELPTTTLLAELGARVRGPAQVGGGMRSFMLAGGFGGGAVNAPDPPFQQIGHCLWALLAALLGGVVSSILFGGRRQRDEKREIQPQVAAQSPRRQWLWATVLGLSGGVVIVFLGALVPGSAVGFWAGATFLATCGLLGANVLGAASSQGTRRPVWLGAALFGVGYMTLAFGRSQDPETWPRLPTDHLLHSLRYGFPPIASGFPPPSAGVAPANARIAQVLEQTVPMRFNEETPLEDVLKSIKAAARSPDGKGIPIYVDPIGISEADKTMASTVRNIDLEGVALKTSLRLTLEQLDLSYVIRDGLLLITSAESNFTRVNQDPFLIVGHCLLALLAAALGGVAGALMSGNRRALATRVAGGQSEGTVSGLQREGTRNA